MKRKTALITGGAKGIGKMITRRLALDGYNVVINYHKSENEALELATQLRSYGVQVLTIQGDMTDLSDIQNIVSEILNNFETIDILINNAGPFIHERKPFSEYSIEEIRFLINGHLLGIMELENYILPMMQQNEFGRIIHIGLDKAHEGKGYPLRSVYAAARVGLMSFTKSLAVEEASNNITVNMICIGDIRDPYKEMSINEAFSIKEKNSITSRPGTGDDIARLVSFLVAEDSSFITGGIIDVNGGLDPIFKKAQQLKKFQKNRSTPPKN